MGFLLHFDIEVTGGATTGTHVTLGHQTDTHSAAHTCRNLHSDGAVATDTSVAVTRAAGVGNDLAGTTTVGAGVSGDNLAKEGLLNFLNLAATATVRAGFGLCSRF